ncbi:MAG: UDP-N-acetylmuramate dehydrogenase [Pseudomonadales bacterium]
MAPVTAATNTLHLAAQAERVIEASEERLLLDTIAAARGAGRRLTILGGGSNVVLQPRLDGWLVRMRTRGVRVSAAGPGAWHVTAAAGERWHDLVRFVLAQGWAGLENLVLIPGSVGAAPMQNIGAYGVELKDRFVALRAVDRESGTIRRFDLDECGFRYRDSVFKSELLDRFVILDVTLRVAEHAALQLDYPDVRAELAHLGVGADSPRLTPVMVAEAICRVRRRKLPDPRRVGNVGSFFKNPELARAAALALRDRHGGLSLHESATGTVKLSAAQLIDRCGWKGRRSGDAGVWRRQPLVLVNYGNASAADILALAADIRDDVQRRFGVLLEFEPRILGSN